MPVQGFLRSGELTKLNQTSFTQVLKLATALSFAVGCFFLFGAGYDSGRDKPGIVTGQFSHGVSQKPGVTTPVSLQFDMNDITLAGIAHSTTVDNEEFTATITKSYAFMLAPQWERTSSGGTRTIDFFMQKSTDGGTIFVDLINSNVKVVAGSNDSNVIPLMYTVAMNVNDIVRFQMRVSTTSDGLGTIFTAAEVGPPTIPATPAQILTIFSGD